MYFGQATSAFSHLAQVEIPASLPSATLLPFRAGNDASGVDDAGRAALAELERGAPPGINVCVGKEWYRFPSSFFLPELPAGGGSEGTAPRVRLQFVESSFGGQLPQHFPEGGLNGKELCAGVGRRRCAPLRRSALFPVWRWR